MTLSKKSKQLIALFVIALAMLLIYLSAYLPYVKATLYIRALSMASQAKTLQDFLNPFQEAFNFWSPIGQPEEIRFFASDISGVLNQNTQLPKDVAKELVSYTVGMLNSNPQGGKGLNYSQALLLEANILSTYGKTFNDSNALNTAEKLFKEGLKLSPTRPQFLYGLFSLYLAEGKNSDAKPIGETILKYWPNDKNVASLLANIK